MLLTLVSDSLLLFTINSLGFGGIFMGATSLVITVTRQLSVSGDFNLSGFMTLIYDTGQIPGPALTNMLGNGTPALVNAILCDMAMLFIVAFTSMTQLFKLQMVAP